MKAFLVAVSSLCLCGVLLSFLVYAMGNFPRPKTTKDTPASISSQQAITEETDPLCSPCVERIALMLEMVQEWEANIPASFAQQQKPVEADTHGWAGLFKEQREQAKRLFDQFGTEEGLRRLREVDPEAARQFEREHRGAPSRDEVNDESLTQ